ncbi:unnamed protein product [Amoebophrya sp. A25]|nr:unnamed protein product [Amoebophrya sp. A25]|eukprot:GSA25T00022513001.1
MTPGQRKKMEEDEKRKAEEDARRKKLAAENEERRKIQEEEDRKQAEADKVQAELDNQKKSRAGRDMEDAQKLQDAAVEMKRRKLEQEQRNRELQKTRRTRFSKGFDASLLLQVENELKSSWPRPSAAAFECSKFFPTDNEKTLANRCRGLMLFVKKILFNATVEDEMQYFLEQCGPALKKYLETSELEPVEVLYAASFVASEMVHKKALPDYNSDTGVLESFFWELYQGKLVAEAEFLQWFDDLDDETQGRTDVIFQVTPFMHFLRPPPPPEEGEFSDEDEDDEEGEEDDE